VQVNKNKRNNESSFKNCSFRIDKFQLVVNEQLVMETFDYPLIKRVVISPFCCELQYKQHLNFISLISIDYQHGHTSLNHPSDANNLFFRYTHTIFEQDSSPPI
jgi:hypothetical protein